VKKITRVTTVDAEELERLLAPRDDIVGERAAGGGRFDLADGPFTRYLRTVEVLPPEDGRADDRARYRVRQTFEFEMPPGSWAFLMWRLIARGLRRRPAGGRMPLWAPPQRPDARGVTVLGLLATLALVVGYHGTLLGQTMTFVAEEFDAGTTAQGVVLSVARVGGLLTIVLAALADRRGRRRMLTASLLACIGSTAVGAITPNLEILAATQAINRGAWAAATALLAVIAAEEMPAGARAFALGVLAMSMAVGAGMALVILPIADIGEQAWRVLYAAPLLMVPAVLHYTRLLPESRRYERPHPRVAMSQHIRYLWLICLASFLLNVFLGPAPQFRNEFLRDERAFSALDLSLFAMLTAIPGALGILAGGRLAETVGRRRVVGFSASLGGVLVAMSFILGGPSMWIVAMFGTVLMAALAPSFTVYNAELFPTGGRGRATGLFGLVAMGGSIVGLMVAGTLRDAFDSFGPTMAMLAIAPVLMAVLVVSRYPETAFRELEELNPEDALPPDAETRRGVNPGPAGPPGSESTGSR
jgi:MFS family permease